ncbi:hypothetical protein JKF63_03752 [Porcisia hertigi]|uniref:Uncharacterized protein n=1 Tax=Porcisia hertigi TaxID=2761500 RepID=A0A836HR25_9TRYP|nr:hypothetical protein JKF63_03752 [Porcisia hertigi]
MSKVSPRVRRFDEVDSDSDVEVQAAQPRRAMPSLSFKTVSVTEDSESIAFESDCDSTQHSGMVIASAKNTQKDASSPTAHLSKSLPPALKQASPAAVASSTPPASTTKKTVTNRTPAAEAQPLQQPTPLAKSAGPLAISPSVTPDDSAAHISLVGPAQVQDDDDDDRASDEFIQHVLPIHPHRTARGPQPPAFGVSQKGENSGNGAVRASRLWPSAADDATDELLVRAQLRLEERRRKRTPSQPGSFQLSPPRGVAPLSVNTLFRQDTPRQMANHVSPTTSFDPRIRRLQQENTRLQDEVAFLGRENQKLRSMKCSADASEALRLQLTVDMLRKELESKQLRLQRTLDTTSAEVREAKRQIEDTMEQCEGYHSAADQYKQLYSDKQKELEKVKTQLQSLFYDVNAMEQHQRAVDSEYADQLASEREKAERAVALVEEVKRQRDQLQSLITQLRNEVSTAVEAKRQAVEQVTDAVNTARRNRAEYEQRIQQLNEDMVQLKKTLADQDRAQEIQLREAQQAQAALQERLKGYAEAQQREAERSRCTLEAAREDHRRVLQQEKMRRVEMEEQLRRMEEEGRAAQSRYTASLNAEAETRVRKLREEVQAERLAREAVEREVVRLTTEVEHLRESADYHQQETRRISNNFAQSEQLREKAERQCASLTHTLEDMMAQEEAHAREIEQLKGAVSSAAQGGSSIVAVGGGADVNDILIDLQQLSEENDRLTGECTRLAGERDVLIEENGRIAEELLKWKHEMRQCLTARTRPTSS